MLVYLTFWLGITASVILATTPTSPPTAIGYTYGGCFHEPPSGRALNAASNLTSGSVENCANFCWNAGNYQFFGVEYHQQCFCGNDLNFGTYYTLASACKDACTLNSSELCGGPSVLSLYNLTNPGAFPAPTSVPETSGSYTFAGCFHEPQVGQALSSSKLIGAGSVDACAADCVTNGVASEFFGVENSGDCYCGNSINTLTYPTTGCKSPCTGNKTQICGGKSILDLYKLPGATIPSCITGPYVIDGGFETGMNPPAYETSTGWGVYNFIGSTGYDVTSPGSQAGDNGGQYALTSTLAPGPYSDGMSGLIISQNMNTCAGQNYSVYFDFVFSSTASNLCSFKISYPLGGLGVTGSVTTPSGIVNPGQWYINAATFQAPSSGSSLVSFTLSCSNNELNTIGLDNVILAPYPYNAY